MGEGEETPEAASSFVGELRGVMRTLYNHPSIVSWIPFNEGWGQFDTRDIFAWMQSYDPQRLLWVWCLLRQASCQHAGHQVPWWHARSRYEHRRRRHRQGHPRDRSWPHRRRYGT